MAISTIPHGVNLLRFIFLYFFLPIQFISAEESIDVYPLLGSSGKDLSGLAICDNKLLAIADNINDYIYEISFQNRSATLQKYLTIPTIPKAKIVYNLLHYTSFIFDTFPNDRFDWEAISCTKTDIFLASENRIDVLQVNANTSRWLELDLYSNAQKNNFAHSYNGFIEGLSVTDDSIFGFFERNSRGAFIHTRKAPYTTVFKQLPNNFNLIFLKNSLDISGSFIDGEFLYTLERGASSICKRAVDTLITEDCISYRNIEKSPEYRFKDAAFGLGEGLALNKDYIFVVFDNNRTQREANGSDLALLLRIKRPKNW